MVALNNNFELDNPSESVLMWCRSLVAAAAQDAVWGIPRSGTTFRIDKKNKTLVLIVPGLDDGDDFRATKRVFGHIGWDVIEDKSGTTKP
jgi:hypothetical protein